MTLPPPHSTRIDTLVPYTTLFRATAMNRWARQHRFTRATSRPPRRRAVAWSIALLVVALVACIGLAGGVRAAPAADLWDRWTVSDQSSQASRSEEHTSELQSLMRISYAVFCLKKKQYRPQNQ